MGTLGGAQPAAGLAVGGQLYEIACLTTPQLPSSTLYSSASEISFFQDHPGKHCCVERVGAAGGGGVQHTWYIRTACGDASCTTLGIVAHTQLQGLEGLGCSTRCTRTGHNVLKAQIPGQV